MLTLTARCPEYLAGYKAYCQEMYDRAVPYFRPMDPARVDEDWFYRTKLVYDARETARADRQSRSLHFWAVDGDEFIGEFQLRLDFTEKVLTDIGSVGYAVRPSLWGRGYGYEILRQGTEIARARGMEKLLFTVNGENVRSIHVVEKLGAVWKDTIDAENEAEGRHRLRRYWLSL